MDPRSKFDAVNSAGNLVNLPFAPPLLSSLRAFAFE